MLFLFFVVVVLNVVLVLGVVGRGSVGGASGGGGRSSSSSPGGGVVVVVSLTQVGLGVRLLLLWYRGNFACSGSSRYRKHSHFDLKTLR